MKVLTIFIYVLQFSLLTASSASTSTGPQARDGIQKPPNIILLVTDDQRWDALGAYGNNIIHTPNIDRMASEGILFENMFVTTSICAPSRATIMTGQYPSRHGIRDFRTSLTQEQLRQTYMGRLKSAGYRIGFIGKWGVGTSPENFLDYDKTFPGQGHYFPDINGEKRHLTSVMGDQALEFLEKRSSDQPFMLSISFKAAHVQDSYDVSSDQFQYDPELSELYDNTDIPIPEKADPKYYEQLPEFLKDSENRMRWAVRFWGPARAQESWKGYYRLISGVDRQVRRIREKLEAIGEDENTIIIYTSDNGMFMGEYGWSGKWYPHEESIRIPLIVYDPRLNESRKGSRPGQQVLTIDIAPTILDLAGIRNSTKMQGRSLVPLLYGEKPVWRSEFFYEHLFKHPRIPKTEAVYTERWKYIRYVDQKPVYEQLFDLKNDPDEVHNLISDDKYESIKNMMRRKWKKWYLKVRE